MPWIPLAIEEIAHVLQERVSAVDGDCMQACIASLLRIPLASVPSFHRQPDGSIPPAYNWLSERRLWFEYLHRQDDGTFNHQSGKPQKHFSGYAMASVPSALFPGTTHAVVVKDGVVAWDPSPHASERAVPYEPVDHFYRLVFTGVET
jgi:hypothetical protein